MNETSNASFYSISLSSPNQNSSEPMFSAPPTNQILVRANGTQCHSSSLPKGGFSVLVSLQHVVSHSTSTHPSSFPAPPVHTNDSALSRTRKQTSSIASSSYDDIHSAPQKPGWQANNDILRASSRHVAVKTSANTRYFILPYKYKIINNSSRNYIFLLKPIAVV